MKKLYPIILAGGKGTRFWPLSSLKSPKYTLRIFGKKSLFEECFSRAKLLAREKCIHISTNKDQVKIINKKNLVIEPVGRNTAPAIGLAAVTLLKKDPEAVLVIMPADHLIKNKKSFAADVNKAYKFVLKNPDAFVTFGIKPNQASNEYGYIKLKTPACRQAWQTSNLKPVRVSQFIEKPNIKRAAKFIKSKNYFWNSGIFVFKAKTYLENLKKYNRKLYNGLTKGNVKNNFSKLPNISIDNAILEKAKSLFVIPAKFDWDDVGSWLALERHMKKDKSGNVVKGKHTGIKTKNTTIYNTEKRTVTTVGVEDLVIVQTKKAILVAKKDKLSLLKQI